MNVLNVKSNSTEQTEALAAKLSDSFTDGDLVVLTGELGAGKTAFVRGLARGRKLNEQLVTSPSYTFVNEYPGERPIFHFDLYRLTDPVELFEIGWEEYLSRPGLVVVEWGEKAQNLLPEKYYSLVFEIIDSDAREINLSLVQP